MILAVEDGEADYYNYSFNVYAPTDISPNYISVLKMAKESTKAIKLRTLINPFGMINDMNGEDELKISIYSDVIEGMFSCETYTVKERSMIDFKGLEVPCKDVVTITLTEKDWLFNDGHTLMVSCREYSS